MSETRPRNRWFGPAVFFGLVVIFGYQMIGDDGTEATPPEPTSTFNVGDAVLNCEDAVKRELNNPATADFSVLDTDTAELPDGGWSVAGVLTAENDFGVEQEVAFSCKVREGEPVEVEVQ